MSKRHPHLWLIVLLLLLGAGFRMWALNTLPPGFSDPELQTLTVTETVSAGQIRVFAPNGKPGEVQETLFHVFQAALTGLTGKGQFTLRLVSVWSGMLALAAVTALAFRLYNPRTALLALGLMAAGFWPSLLSRLTIREALLPLVTAAVLLAFTRAFYIRQRVSPEPPSLTAYSGLGFLVAASLYVHWFGFFLAAFVTLGVIYLYATHQPISRRAANTSLFAIALSIIVIIPYLASSARVLDANGLTTMLAALRPESLPRSFIGALAAIFPRGDQSALFNVPGRPLLGPLLAFLFVIGMIQGLRHWRRPAAFLPTLAALIALIPALLSPRAGAFPALAPALPLIFLVTAHSADTALDWLGRRGPRWRRALPWLAAGVIALNAIWAGADLFRTWPALPEVRAAYRAEQGLLAAYLNQTARSIPTVVCSPRLQDTEAGPGDTRLLSLMMQSSQSRLRYVDCANGLILARGGETQQFAFTDMSIRERIHPALGEWLASATPVSIAGLPEGSVVALDVSTALQDRVGSFLTTAPTGWAPESPGGAGPVTLPVRFGGNLTFLGYQPVADPTYKPDQVVPVITYWRVDGEIPRDLRIFTHVLSDPAAIVAQSSVINVWSPTLQERDIFIQVSYVLLPASLPAGQYDLSIGAYQAASGLRLPIFDGSRVRGDRLFLYQITVADTN